MIPSVRVALLSSLLILLAACEQQADVTGSGIAADDEIVSSGLSWSEFMKGVHVEPDSDVFIVDGDLPIHGEKQLREFYERHVQAGQLIINRIGSADDRWDDARKKALTYCVSTTFGSRHATVVNAMAQAAAAWEQAADVDFHHVSAQDGNCTRSNSQVVFDVNPVNSGSYLARAFFPSSDRSRRNVLIDGTAFGSNPSLTGILRHELGHALGFRHEHTRPESGRCFEDSSWRALTPYDSSSVMHYPQCNGTASSLELTERDRIGAQAVYGAPGGSTTTPAPLPASGTTPRTETFSGSLAQGERIQHGPFTVSPGSAFEATITGSGDADLYVRFGAAPTLSAYNCRPYLDGSSETCRLTVPSTQSSAYVMVVGYTSATYELKVTYSNASPATGDTQAPTFAGLSSANAISPTSVELAWAAASDNSTAASAIIYDVYVSAGSTVSFTSPRSSTQPGQTRATVTGLSASTQYAFAVRARDAAGNRDANAVARTATTPAPEASTGGDNPSFEEQVVTLVNQRRAAGANCGGTFYPAVPALVMNAKLRNAARLHSTDMAENNYFSHTSQDGRSPFQRMAAAGYTSSPMGENIAAGYSTPSSVVSGWMSSSGHCKNIMRSGFRAIGVGYASGGSYGHYWTQNFGGVP